MTTKKQWEEIVDAAVEIGDSYMPELRDRAMDAIDSDLSRDEREEQAELAEEQWREAFATLRVIGKEAGWDEPS